MGITDITNHLLNFTAPGAAVALITAVFARQVVFKSARMPGLSTLVGVSFGVCLATSVAGLWMFRSDGRVVTYAAMAAACATTQWVMARAWKA